MHPGHLRDLMAIENSYWWHQAKRTLVLETLRRHFPAPRRLLEGGVGAGGNLRAFAAAGYTVSGLDISEMAVEHCHSLGLENVRAHDLEQPWPAESGSVDVVVMLDVLEHLADPVAALRHARQVLAPGGGLVVTVPAGAWLFGPWDRMLGHYRRYTPALLRQHAADAGLKTAWLSHWNSFTYPAAWPMRLLQRLRGGAATTEFPKVSPFTNARLLDLAAWERRLMRLVRVPVGLSLVGVLRP